MSVQAEPIKHENKLENLIKEMILKLDILIKHNEQLTDEKFTEKDIK